MKGKDITTKDNIVHLASDEKFQDWILYGHHSEYWKAQLKQNNVTDEAISAARKLVNTLKTGKNLADQSARQSKMPFLKVTGFSKKESSIPLHGWINSKSLKYAASFLLLTCLSILGLYHGSDTSDRRILSTGFGEQKEFVLPDQTHITLNANSSLEVFTNWSDDTPREVKLLKGEALFEVTAKKRSEYPTFKVISNQMTVEVLGTVFTVKSRRKRTDVALIEGKVNVLLDGKKVSEMKAGSTFSYTRDIRISESPSGAKKSAGWIEQKLHLQNTTLNEIAAQIEDQYGWPVHLSDSLKSKRLSGELPLESLEVLLAAIEVSLDVKATVGSHSILIQKINDSRDE